VNDTYGDQLSKDGTFCSSGWARTGSGVPWPRNNRGVAERWEEVMETGRRTTNGLKNDLERWLHSGLAARSVEWQFILYLIWWVLMMKYAYSSDDRSMPQSGCVRGAAEELSGIRSDDSEAIQRCRLSRSHDNPYRSNLYSTRIHRAFYGTLMVPNRSLQDFFSASKQCCGRASISAVSDCKSGCCCCCCRTEIPAVQYILRR